MKKHTYILILLVFIFLMTGCSNSPNLNSDKLDFADTFMLTFETERISGIESRGIRPLLSGVGTGTVSASRATVPASDTAPLDFSTLTGSFDNYPLPGLTTAYTVAAAPEVPVSNVFKITSTTSYPADHVIDTYVETYYLKDVVAGDDTTADDIWNYHDPVVDDTGARDPLYRISMTINYKDGSIRNEKIVAMSPGVSFEPFDVDDSLDYPDFSYPDSGTAVFSSVVVYTHERSSSLDYWFWEGSEDQKILGVRYYTEYSTGPNIIGTLVSYERAFSTYETLGGDFAGSMTHVFIGSEMNTLAESVFRQEVVFNGGEALYETSRMKSHVVNAADYEDFILEKLNDDEVVLSDWENAPYFIPSGTSAEQISDEDYGNFFLTQTVVTNPDGNNLNLFSSGITELADLYAALTNGFASTGIASGNDISGSLEGDSVVAEFSGDEGYSIPSTPALEMSGAAGTVEAWVYVKNHTNTAGIVHKGNAIDFSDESYSLQFMGNKGNVAFAIVKQGPYAYSYAQSSLRLNTDKWYYLAGTYDSSKVRLYIFGEGVKTGNKNYNLVEKNNGIGDPYTPGGPLVLGSQFTEEDRVNGYYGLDGFINGVKVDNTRAKTLTELESFYNANKDKIAFWN